MAANPFSNENGAVLPWIQLSSTLQHQKRSHSKTLFRGPVHTNPFSNENGAVLLWILPSSTLQCQKWSPKTEPFENALQSGAIWKRCFVVWMEKTMLSENGDVNKIDTTGCQTSQPWLSKIAKRRHHMASISRQFLGPIYWNAHASSSFEHAHWRYKSVFRTDTVL